MKSAFNRSILALATILAIAATAPVAAQDKGLKKYESGKKEFWTHPPDDWFLGDETEAQKGLAPPSGPPTGSSDAELAALIKKIKLPEGFMIEVYASGVLAARMGGCGERFTRLKVVGRKAVWVDADVPALYRRAHRVVGEVRLAGRRVSMSGVG